MHNKIHIYSEKEMKSIRKMFKPDIVSSISFSLICSAPIINFFMNINNHTILVRSILLIACLILQFLNWIIYYILYKKYKKDIKNVEQLINAINDELNRDDIIDMEYSREDYNNACAYLINYSYLENTYVNSSDSEYVDNCCSHPQWSIDNGVIKSRIYQIPGFKIKKRENAELMFGYVLSTEVKELLIYNKMATEKDFREVTNKKTKVVCYQIYPQNVFEGFARDNKMKLIGKCKNCGLERYQTSYEPYYMSKEVAVHIKGLNRTKELEGLVLEINGIDDKKEESPIELEPWYIVNREVYLLLYESFPSMKFTPIFPK